MKEHLEKIGDSWRVKRTSDLHLYAISFLHTNWGTLTNGKIPPFFPGPQPISIERKHFNTLKTNEYIVCEKTDGVRNCLLLFNFNGKKVSLLVNRALDLIMCTTNFMSDVYSGTILDGELVDKSFWVYDAVVVKNVNCMNENFLDRYEKICKIFEKKMPALPNNLKVNYKTFYPLYDFKTFLEEHIPSVPYKIDGLIFTPVNEPVKIGTHETLFKWKPLEKNTIDFQLKFERNIWRLYLQEKGKLFYESEIPLDKNESWFKDDMIVECEYHTWDEPMWWKPINVRNDKTHPNNRRTFFRTLVNIRENIEITEFLDLNNGT